MLLRQLAGAERIVFDLDGTLYDSRDFERPALWAVAEWLRAESQLPLEGLAEALWSRRELDRHRPRLFDDLLLEYGLPAAWGPECAQRFRSYPGLELKNAPSLRAMLAALFGRGCRFAVVTNGRAELQRRKLALLGLLEMLDFCICLDPDKPSELKPAPRAWAQLDRWRKGLPTVYVGDDAVDAEFAAVAGIRFVHFCFRSTANDH
jgi:phosphoglycolate phosphatase-like HAD superfamily hydrolase